MSNLGNFFKTVRCDKEDICTSKGNKCGTCLRNKANNYADKFSTSEGGWKDKTWSFNK